MSSERSSSLGVQEVAGSAHEGSSQPPAAVSHNEEEDRYVPHNGEAAAATAAAPLMPIKGRTDLHIGDYVAYERISPTKEWKHQLGKIISFPSAHTAKVANYDAVNSTATVLDPRTEDELRRTAEDEGRLDLWTEREELRGELVEATAAEHAAAQRLFTAREATQQKQADGAARTAQVLQSLDAARTRLRNVPQRQWRDLRSNGQPNEALGNLVRALMLVMHEDRANTWESAQSVMRQPNFMDRFLDWDCTAAPMSAKRRRSVVNLCAKPEEVMVGARKKRTRATSPTNEVPQVPAVGEGAGAFAVLDGACRAWVNAQLACSATGDAQAALMEECLAEQQEQRVLLREVNDMRVDISRVEEQMAEKKVAILGIETLADTVHPVKTYQAETHFYKRTYPGEEGRFVQEVILRDCILQNFGPHANEDTEGYVQLDDNQRLLLQDAMHSTYVRHDADEMEDLVARKEREEVELAELRARVAELQAKGTARTPEEEEELEQLERLLQDAERRHAATLTRISDLHTVGRGAREITLAVKRPDFKFTRLHFRMEGDWRAILDDPEQYEAMMIAFQADMAETLHIPQENILDVQARAGSLLIDFTVKHSGEVDDEELQALVNNGDFSTLTMFYEKVTFKKAEPVLRPVNISGLGVTQELSDYYNAEGVLEDDFDAETTADADYRQAVITIPLVREDYDVQAVQGRVDLYTDVDECLPQGLKQLPSEDGDEEEATAGGTAGLTTTAGGLGLTETNGDDAEQQQPEPAAAAAAAAAEEEEEATSMPATQTKLRSAGSSAAAEEVQAQEADSHHLDSPVKEEEVAEPPAAVAVVPRTPTPTPKSVSAPRSPAAASSTGAEPEAAAAPAPVARSVGGDSASKGPTPKHSSQDSSARRKQRATAPSDSATNNSEFAREL